MVYDYYTGAVYFLDSFFICIVLYCCFVAVCISGMRFVVFDNIGGVLLRFCSL